MKDHRQELWIGVAKAVAGAENADSNTIPAYWANTALAEFDKAFPQKKKAPPTEEGALMAAIYTRLGAVEKKYGWGKGHYFSIDLYSDGTGTAYGHPRIGAIFTFGTLDECLEGLFDPENFKDLKS